MDNMIDLDSFGEDIEMNSTIDEPGSEDVDLPDYPDPVLAQGDIIGEDAGYLDVSPEDLETLEERASDIERSEQKGEIFFGSKMCPTRHGCQGATDCNYSYGGYPG